METKIELGSNQRHASTPEVFMVHRRDIPQLRFRGVQLGTGETYDGYMTVERVRVFCTVGGAYVAEHIATYGAELTRCRAHHAKTASEIVSWLRDRRGRFAAAAAAALVEASRRDAAFANAFSEDIA